MSWHEKINNKTYCSVTALNVGIAVLYGYPSLKAMICLVVLVLCSVANHYFTVFALNALILSRISNRDAMNKKKMFFAVICKTLFLILGFMTLIIYVPDKVLQGLSLYIFQLIILALSIKNIGKFFKKGSDS